MKTEKQQASTIASQLKAMFDQIQSMAMDKLIEIAPYDEQRSLFVKVKIEKALFVDIAIYNGLTKAIIIKQYPMMELLNECRNIFNVTTMVDSDTKLLYNKSKEKVFKQNTTLYI